MPGSWHREPGHFLPVPGDSSRGIYFHHQAWNCWPCGALQVVDHPGRHVLHGERDQQLCAQLPRSHALAHDLPGRQSDGQHADGDGVVGQEVHLHQVHVCSHDYHRHCHLHGDVSHEQGEPENWEGGVHRGRGQGGRGGVACRLGGRAE